MDPDGGVDRHLSERVERIIDLVTNSGGDVEKTKSTNSGIWNMIRK